MSVDNGLRPLFRKHLSDFVWTSIETGGTGRGIADSNYLRGGVEGWVEYKATDAFAVVMRPEQIGWLSRRVRAGGRAWIATRRQHKGGPRLGPPVDELWMCDARYVIALSDTGLRSPRVMLVGTGGPARWNWAEVRLLLTGSRAAT